MAQSHIDNLFILARRARSNGDDSAAIRYYEQILVEDPNNWEAVFYSGYCNSASCVIRDIGPAAGQLKNTFVTAFNLVIEQDPPNRDEILYQMCDECNALLERLATAAYNHYMSYSTVNGANAEYRSRVLECGNACCGIGDCFYRINDKRVSTICYKRAVVCWKGQFNLNEVALSRIREYEPDYQPPATGGCYVATAVYGSYDCPQVWTLRRFRDDTLGETWYGRAFIKLYYAISPTLVKWFGNTEWFKRMWRGTLDRMVRDLQEKGVESTPYDDKIW